MARSKHDDNQKKKIITVLKNINGGIFAINMFNCMFGMEEPKVLVIISKPGNDGSGKNEVAKFYLGWEDMLKLTRSAYYRPNPTNNVIELLKLYRGGNDNKKDCVVARVFKVYIKSDGVKETYVFEAENVEGEQQYTKDKYGNRTEGIVKPKRGGKSFGKASVGVNMDEFFNIVDALKIEMNAYRSAICYDMLANPEKYAWHGREDNNQQAQSLTTAGGNNTANNNTSSAWGNGFGSNAPAQSAQQPPVQQPPVQQNGFSNQNASNNAWGTGFC